MRTLIDVRDAMESYWVVAEKGKPGEIYNMGARKTIKLTKKGTRTQASRDRKGKDKVPGSHRANVTSTIIPMGMPAWSHNARHYCCRPGSQTSTRAASIRGTAITTLPKTRHGTVIPTRTATTSAEGIIALIFIGY